jgi:hypothetical protein
MQIISIFTIIELCIFGLVLLLYLCLVPILCFSYCEKNAEEKKKKRNNLAFAKSFIERYNPIPIPTDDTTCAICLQDAEENDNSWTELSCKHKYHLACITESLKYNTLCPYCRSPVTLEDRTKMARIIV